MAEARAVAERFFERFGIGDLDGAFALFSADCIALTPSGPLNNEKHRQAAEALKRALPDSSMVLLRVIEHGEEVYVTGRFKGTHSGDLATPIGTLRASGGSLDLIFVDYFRVGRQDRRVRGRSRPTRHDPAAGRGCSLGLTCGP